METDNPKNKPTNGNNKELKRRTAAFSRWLHVYLSMLSFFLVLFFSVTGLTLNHADWFDGKQIEQKYIGKLSPGWVTMKDTTKIRKLEIVEFLRKNYNIKGFVSDFLIQDDQCTVSFKGPGYSADAFISRKDGSFHLSEIKLGVVALLNDLHKGRDSGKRWGLLIDISSIFLTLVSLSGLVMLFFLRKKRISGLVLLGIGTAVCWLIYVIYIQ